MLISPELLNTHSSASWQMEFGLSSKKLGEIAQSALKPYINSLGLKDASVVYFEDRKAFHYAASKHKLSLDDLKAFRIRAQNSKDCTLLSIEDPKILNLLNQYSDLNIDTCMLCTFSEQKEKIHGYYCIFGPKSSFADAAMQALSSVVSYSITQAIVASKYKRLDTDRDELQELIVNTNGHPIFAKDRDSRLVFANQSFIDLYPPEKRDKIIGYTTVEDYPEEQRNMFLQDDVDAFELGEKKVVEAIDFPSGKRTMLETTKRRFKTSSGNDYILGVSYDITQQYELIEMLKNKNKDLDQVATMLATDVRAPANAMVKLIKWIQEDLHDLNNPEVAENLREIGARANKLSKQLTAIYQYCFAGRDEQVSSQLLSTEIVSDILSELAFDKELQMNIDENLLYLPRRPVRRVLLELIKNAVEHSNQEVVSFDLSCSEDNKHIYIIVSDCNEQISPERHEQIFMLFESSKAPSDTEISGLGLAIARKIVETYKAQIRIDTSAENGNRFIVMWPKKPKN